MATLTNTKIKDTYDGLLKTTDNEALDASGVTLIEDGLGNASAISIGRSGNGVSVSGNLAVDTNTLYVDAAANTVGIGTDAPIVNLHIKDSGAIIARLESTTDANTTIHFGDSADADVGKLTYAHSDNSMQFVVNASERMRIDSSGNVGIGESNPSSSAVASGAVIVDLKGNAINRGGVVNFRTSDSSKIAWVGFDGGLAKFGTETSNDTVFYTANTERMRIDSSGNVGLANSNPVTRLDIDGFITLRNAPYPSPTSGVLKDGFIGSDDGTLKFTINGASNAAYGSMAFITRKGDSTDPIEAMRITSAGDVLIGTTTPITALGKTLQISSTSNLAYFKAESNSSLLVFRNSSNSTVGSISIGSSSTAYNTSSDYRLKENVVEMTGALDRVDALKPSRFNFIADPETTVDGFLAHEVAEVIPEAITGEKDAVDEEGNPIYQGIDQSKIVPLLVGAIKELRAEIELLKAK